MSFPLVIRVRCKWYPAIVNISEICNCFKLFDIWFSLNCQIQISSTSMKLKNVQLLFFLVPKYIGHFKNVYLVNNTQMKLMLLYISHYGCNFPHSNENFNWYFKSDILHRFMKWNFWNSSKILKMTWIEKMYKVHLSERRRFSFLAA